MTIAELLRLVENDPPLCDCRVTPPGVNNDCWLARLVRRLRPSLTVELGTGDGYTASRVASILHKEGYFVTINWPNPPSGDDPTRYLGQYLGKLKNVTLVYGDTREESWRFADDSIELLYIDSTHTYNCATSEWIVYRPKLTNGAVVVVDNLDHNDMMRFWESLPYDNKVRVQDGRVGVFRYKSSDDK